MKVDLLVSYLLWFITKEGLTSLAPIKRAIASGQYSTYVNICVSRPVITLTRLDPKVLFGGQELACPTIGTSPDHTPAYGLEISAEDS